MSTTNILDWNYVKTDSTNFKERSLCHKEHKMKSYDNTTTHQNMDIKELREQ